MIVMSCTGYITQIVKSNKRTFNRAFSSCIRSKRFASFIALVGPPGSGKGTYGSLLAEKLNIPHLQVGDVLRKHVDDRTEIGKNIEMYQAKGKLVEDDDLIGRALFQHLEEQAGILDPSIKVSTRGIDFILDGFPRKITQVQYMQSKSWPSKYQLLFAVNINVPDEICIGKMIGRRKCSICFESFNITNINTEDGFVMPPKLPEPYPCVNCNMDNGDWIVRSDDTSEDVMFKRMQEYHSETTPILQHYEDQGMLVKFTPFCGVDDMHILEQLVQSQLKDETL